MEQLLSKTAGQYLLKLKHTCALKPINSIPQSKGIKHTSNKVHSKKSWKPKSSAVSEWMSNFSTFIQ